MNIERKLIETWLFKILREDMRSITPHHTGAVSIKTGMKSYMFKIMLGLTGEVEDHYISLIKEILIVPSAFRKFALPQVPMAVIVPWVTTYIRT